MKNCKIQIKLLKVYIKHFCKIKKVLALKLKELKQKNKLVLNNLPYLKIRMIIKLEINLAKVIKELL